MAKEPRPSFWQWIGFITPYIYVCVIGLIVAWMVVSIAMLSIQEYTSPRVTASASSQEIQQNATWMELVVKPIVTSPYNQIIFRGMFYILVWVLLFLIVPVAFLRLKKFKLFSMEFEVEQKEKAAVEMVKIHAAKAQLMSTLTGPDAKGKTLAFLRGDVINYYEVLEYFLEEINAGYRKTFNTGFSFELYVQNVPNAFRALMEESQESGYAVIYNKKNNENLFMKNILLYAYTYRGEQLVTVLSSHTTQFDTFDRHLLELLHHVLDTYVESIEDMVALTSPAQSSAQTPQNKEGSEKNKEE